MYVLVLYGGPIFNRIFLQTEQERARNWSLPQSAPRIELLMGFSWAGTLGNAPALRSWVSLSFFSQLPISRAHLFSSDRSSGSTEARSAPELRAPFKET